MAARSGRPRSRKGCLVSLFVLLLVAVAAYVAVVVAVRKAVEYECQAMIDFGDVRSLEWESLWVTALPGRTTLDFAAPRAVVPTDEGDLHLRADRLVLHLNTIRWDRPPIRAHGRADEFSAALLGEVVRVPDLQADLTLETLGDLTDLVGRLDVLALHPRYEPARPDPLLASTLIIAEAGGQADFDTGDVKLNQAWLKSTIADATAEGTAALTPFIEDSTVDLVVQLTVNERIAASPVGALLRDFGLRTGTVSLRGSLEDPEVTFEYDVQR